MGSTVLVLLLTFIMSLTMPAGDVFAYGGGGGGGGSDRAADSDVMGGSAAQCTSFAQENGYPLGIGCGWGVGVLGAQDVSDVGGSAYGDPIEDSRSTSKDAQTALNELRDKYEAGSMTAQDVKQDLQWGQQMGVYTSEQSQALLQDLNIEKTPNQPHAQQQSPAAPPAPQRTKYEQDCERIRFLMSMLLRDRDWDVSPRDVTDERWEASFADTNVEMTFYLLTMLYLSGKNQSGEYDDEIRSREIRQRLRNLRKQ